MKTYKYLFLDVDGVLNNTISLRQQKTFYALDTDCLNQLRRIYDAVPGLRIVLSSYWRHNKDSTTLLAVRLREKGMDLYDYTQTNFSMGVLRNIEIDKWLEHNKHDGEPAVAIDDDNDILDAEHYVPVVVDSSKGLTESDADKVIKSFLEQESSRKEG